jgi:dolichol kinase
MSIGSLMAVELIWRDQTITRIAAIVVGVGDGIAEPIGTRFGRHSYKTPGCLLRTCDPPRRSLEGSAVVCLGAFFQLYRGDVA